MHSTLLLPSDQTGLITVPSAMCLPENAENDAWRVASEIQKSLGKISKSRAEGERVLLLQI